MSIYDEYIRVIGESVPLMMLPEDWDEKQIEAALQKCIESKKPFNIADYNIRHNDKLKY